MARIIMDKQTENTGLIRYANAGAVLQKTLASGLADAFSKQLLAWWAKCNPVFSPEDFCAGRKRRGICGAKV